MDDLLMADLRKLACQPPSAELWATILERVGPAIYNLDSSTDSKGYNAVADYVQHIVSSWPKEVPLRVPYTAYAYERYRLMHPPLRDKLNWEVPMFSVPEEDEMIRGTVYRSIFFLGMERTFMWLRDSQVWITVNYLDYYTFATLLPHDVKFEERSRICTTWLGALMACSHISHALFQETLPCRTSLEDEDLTAKQIIEKRKAEQEQAEKDLRALIEHKTIAFTGPEEDILGATRWPYPVFLPSEQMLFERHHLLNTPSPDDRISYRAPVWGNWNGWRWGYSDEPQSSDLRIARNYVFVREMGDNTRTVTRIQAIHATGLFCVCVAPEGVNHYLRRRKDT